LATEGSSPTLIPPKARNFTTSSVSESAPKRLAMPDDRHLAPIERVLARLSEVAEQGDGWTALCPAHADQNPSLSIAEGEDGRVLLYCHAGCDVEDIAIAINITMAELFPVTRAALRVRRASIGSAILTRIRPK
jgi:hypothetical protein